VETTTAPWAGARPPSGAMRRASRRPSPASVPDRAQAGFSVCAGPAV